MQTKPLEERVAALERSNRKLRLGLVAAAAFAAALSLTGFRQGVQDKVQTRELDIVNADGNNVITAKEEKGGGVIMAVANGGKGTVALRASDQGNVLQMMDSTGTIHSTLGVATDSNGFLLLSGKSKDSDRTLLGLDDTGVRLYRGDTKAVVIGADETGGFAMTAKDGAVTGTLPSKQD